MGPPSSRDVVAFVIHDLLIVGGGINGAAIAREASLNGWSVMLIERGDLAGATSSKSSGLIHGGLRYLEQYDFRLVADALAERERMVKAAPHLVRPMRFVIPHVNAIRPWWLVRLGLVLYDVIGGKRTLSRSRSLRRSDHLYFSPLRGNPRGFIYSDAQVDDARLVVLNALDAARAGAEIATRCALISATRTVKNWTAELSDGRTVTARALVNATGPWVAEMLACAGVTSNQRVRLVKGSHVVVPRLYDGEHAYLLQQPDRRIVFVLPWQGMTVIGTTDVPVTSPDDTQISEEEIQYLCKAVSDAFEASVAPGDVISSWSGIRPLHDDGKASAQGVSRDYLLELDCEGAPALTVFGGKITTARHLAEKAVGRLASALGREVRPVTRQRVLPGGETDDPDHYAERAAAAWPFLGQERARRMAQAYGSMLPHMLNDVTDLGCEFGAGFTEVEARWMQTDEWARTPEDVLMRRSKLGFHMSDAERADFAAWWTKTFDQPKNACLPQDR